MSEIKRLEYEQNMIVADYKQQVNNANLKIDSLESQVWLYQTFLMWIILGSYSTLCKSIDVD